MMGFEKQLEVIADKQKLHAFIDELPEGAKGILLFDIPDAGSESVMRYRSFGDITIAESSYFTQLFLHHVIFRNE